MMADLNELHYFVQVAQAQSFTAAAKRLGMPKSSISRAIARLEGRLGVRLVERTTRRVSLTEAGEVYLDRCQHVLEEAERADLEVGALLAKPRGRLRIAAPAIFARVILGPTLGAFLSRYPDLRVNVQFLGPDLPREGSLDLIICAGPLEDSGLLVKPLFQIRLGIYASPAYLADREPPDSPASLRQQSCIVTSCGTFGEPGSAALWRLRRNTEAKEVKVESRVAAPDPAITQQLAVSGAGVALLSRFMARPDVEAGRLVRILPDWEPEPVQLHALYSSRLHSSPKVRAFLQFLREQFGGDPLRDVAAGKLEIARPEPLESLRLPA